MFLLHESMLLLEIGVRTINIFSGGIKTGSLVVSSFLFFVLLLLLEVIRAMCKHSGCNNGARPAAESGENEFLVAL